MKRFLLFLVMIALLLPSLAVADVLTDGWEDASLEELQDALARIEAKITELEADGGNSTDDSELVVIDVKESSFLDDLAAGLVARWSDDRDTSTMSDRQLVDYYSALVMYELDKVGPYATIEFSDPVLGEYAHTYISALQDQLIAISEYYGNDDVLYNEYWSSGYRKRGQMIYWINRKYGLNIPNKLSSILKEMIEVGKYCDMEWSIQETITSQLQLIDCSFTKNKSNRLELGAFTITNNSGYPINSLTIKMDFLDANDNVIDLSYLISSSDVAAKGSIQTRKQTIYEDSFAKIRFSVSAYINSGYYYDQTSFVVTPQIQYAWSNATIKRNGEIASGQAILEIQDISSTWDFNKSWSQTLYVPQIKFSIKNTGTNAAERVVVHCVFTNTATQEVWDEETVYVIGSSDSPLSPGFSKKVFVYSSVGYKTAPYTVPNLTVDIYVNDVLLTKVESIGK